MARLIIEIDIDVDTDYRPGDVARDIIIWPQEVEIEGDDYGFSIEGARWKK